MRIGSTQRFSLLCADRATGEEHAGTKQDWGQTERDRDRKREMPCRYVMWHGANDDVASLNRPRSLLPVGLSLGILALI